jgi:hypothetical protein
MSWQIIHDWRFIVLHAYGTLQVSSSVNAKLAKRRADTTALLRSSGGQPVVVESLPRE